MTFRGKVTYVLQQNPCIAGSRTGQTLVTLAGQSLEFLKNGLLPFDLEKIAANYVVGKNGTEHPGFELAMLRKSAKYYHNCHIRYSQYNLARKKKSLQSKNKKLKWGNLMPFYVHLWAQILVHLQYQQIQILFALYAVNMLSLGTLMLLGLFMRLNQH